MKFKLNQTMQEIPKVLNINIFYKEAIVQPFEKSDLQNIKELFYKQLTIYEYYPNASEV